MCTPEFNEQQLAVLNELEAAIPLAVKLQREHGDTTGALNALRDVVNKAIGMDTRKDSFESFRRALMIEQAFDKALADAREQGAERFLCLGDVVGYGPDPAGAIRILRERGIPTVMGNHDAAVSGWRDTDGMIDTAREGTERHRRELGKGDLDWLRALPYVYENDGFAVAHANFANPHFMDYIHDRFEARDSMTSREERMLFVGHTHVPAVFTLGFFSDLYFPDCRHEEDERDFRMKEGCQYLVNVGAVGYPRVRPYSNYDFRGYADAMKAKSIPVPPWIEERIYF